MKRRKLVAIVEEDDEDEEAIKEGCLLENEKEKLTLVGFKKHKLNDEERS